MATIFAYISQDDKNVSDALKYCGGGNLCISANFSAVNG